MKNSLFSWKAQDLGSMCIDVRTYDDALYPGEEGGPVLPLPLVPHQAQQILESSQFTSHKSVEDLGR